VRGHLPGVRGSKHCCAIVHSLKQSDELFWGEEPIAFGHKLADLIPVGFLGEPNSNPITTTPRGEKGETHRKQGLPLVLVGSKGQEWEGTAVRVHDGDQQTEGPASDIEAVCRRPLLDPRFVYPLRHLGKT
jgi:hypothetical protein